MPRVPLLLGLFLALPACTRESLPPPIPATVRAIREPSELLWGPSAFGQLGDLRLENGRLMAVIAEIDRPLGFAVSGGNLVDIAPLPDGEDHINQVILYLNDQFPRQARYEKLEILERGGGKRRVVVRARGKDSHDPRIAIETDYILEPDANWLTLETRFTSNATTTIAGFIPGDAVQWGRAEHMAPGVGFRLAGSRRAVDWLAGLGANASYALVPDGPVQFQTISGSTWSDPMGPKIDLLPKKTASYRRYIVVGNGDTASLAGPVHRLRQEATGRIEGRVTHDGKPLLGSEVHVLADSETALVGIARTDAEGWYSLELRPGVYRAFALAPGRERVAATGQTGTVHVKEAGTHSQNFNLGPEAVIRWRVQGHDGKAPPVKITVSGVEGTKEPLFGPVFRASGARNVVLSPRGVGSVPVGAGRYQVVVSRGPEYELIEQRVEVGAGQSAEITGVLARSVDTRGFIAADMHQHAAPSFDSGVSLEDRVLSNGAEGVEVLVATDHNVLTDYRPALAASGLGRDVFTIIGTEATTHSVGHFNAFPLEMDHTKSRGGMQDPEGWSPEQIFAFVRGLAPKGTVPFVQSNHPRAGRIGYFDLMGFNPASGTAKDPRFSADIDGLEVVAFGFRDETKEVLEDWFALLRAGRRITATGNSDSHVIYGRETGWPRTYVCVEDDTPPRLDVQDFVSALRSGCATISGGPFVTLRSGETRMGSLAEAPKGKAKIEVRVLAPSWIDTTRLTLFVDGHPKETVALPREPVLRLERSFEASCSADCFITVLVEGDEPLSIVLPGEDGRVSTPVALTNPIYFDVDGDGQFEPKPKSPR